MQPAANLSQRIEAEANNLGFSLFGITRPSIPLHYETYRAWVEAGRHAALDYMARPDSQRKRTDPGLLLEGCRSIICVGIRYSRPEDIPPAASEPAGRVAAYAWGLDYHEILVPRLQKLADWIAAQTGQPVLARPYTDTGPLLERDLAMQAGLGWIGKNSCLIHPQQGSYFLLAELLLNIDLKPNEPFLADHCGTCTRCIDSCPTDAIRPDRTLATERCISYQTIENKGAIPAELRPEMGDWVFGCDICQQVCPWNVRFASPQADPAFAPQAGIPRPDLHELFDLTSEQFNQRFKHSPIRRAKRRGLLRNATVALGNAASPESVGPLQFALLKEQEPLIRAHVAWALGQIGNQEARRALETARLVETDETVLIEINSALEKSKK